MTDEPCLCGKASSSFNQKTKPERERKSRKEKGVRGFEAVEKKERIRRRRMKEVTSRVYREERKCSGVTQCKISELGE